MRPRKKDPAAVALGRKGARKGGIARAEALPAEQRQEIARVAAMARWSRVDPKLPRATHVGELHIGDAVIPCAVLEDGRRVLTQEGFLHAIGRARKAKGGQGATVDGPPAFLAAKNLQPFISKELEESTHPVIFRSMSGVRAFGYPAELLSGVCMVFLDARDQGALLLTQVHIAARCSILLRGFATVGIIAMVDEATGYQQERDRDELQKILAAYISPELLPWTKRFPDEFYKELFRLRGWAYKPPQVAKPQLVGLLTKSLVYEQLPPGVLDELQRLNPKLESGRRPRKHHQFLTGDIGNPHLSNHLAAVIAVMRLSRNWKDFKGNFAAAFGKKPRDLDFQGLTDEATMEDDEHGLVAK